MYFNGIVDFAGIVHRNLYSTFISPSIVRIIALSVYRANRCEAGTGRQVRD
jgi:hypothetical protein